MSKTKERVELPTSNRFEFHQPIGSGGMGTVYKAFDRRTKEFVAIKVLKQKLSENPTLHRRLAREFRAAHELEHPNIVRAIAFENDGPTSFVVFELVEGCSVGDRIEEFGRFEESDAIRIITQIAQALHYAHQRQVVHRDVKPDNIMLLPDGRVKLTDFGLAKDYSCDGDQDLTRHAAALGTPHYMAPEQFADAKSAGPLCDVYSLGATLYNLVTGRQPFDAKVPMAILAKKETASLSARKVVPGLSENIDHAIRQAVNPDPKKRPESCLEFFKLINSRRKSSRESLTKTPMPSLSRVMPAVNRRASIRFPTRIGTLGVVDVSIHTDGSTEEHWPVVVHDLSSGGVKMLLARRFEPGADVALELLDEATRKNRRFPVRVVRVSRDRAGHWVHGCRFDKPLSDANLKILLKLA